MQSTRNIPELLLGLGIACLGLFICWQASGIKVAPVYAKVGPAVFPWIIGGLLAAAGALIALQASRKPEPDLPVISYLGPGVIAAGLILQFFLLEPLGFILTAALVFLMTAFGFGSRTTARDIIVALILAVTVYLVFTRGLGLRLPQGIIPL